MHRIECCFRFKHTIYKDQPPVEAVDPAHDEKVMNPIPGCDINSGGILDGIFECSIALAVI